MNVFTIQHWDLLSVVLYSIMGLVPIFAIYKTNHHSSEIVLWKNKFYIFWIVIWILFASFRYIGDGIGGTDAENYLIFFEHCFNVRGFTGSVAQYYDNIGFRWYNQILYLIYPNDRFYLIVTYGILTIGIIYFVNFFRFKRESSIPFFLLVFWYLRGFSSIRSNLAAIILLISFVFLYKKKYSILIALVVISFLIHSMSALFALFIPFYFFYKKKNIGYKNVVLIIMSLFIITVPLKGLFLQHINLFGETFSDQYEGYVTSGGQNFFSSFWKIAFEQFLLLFFMILNRRDLFNFKSTLDHDDQSKFDFIYKLCLYDFILIPICYALNIWRGYEFLYIPRLIMWAILMFIGSTKCSKRFVPMYELAIFCLFLGWFLQRTSSESFWLDTSLMPYVFAPLIN